MNVSEYMGQDAVGLADLIARREVTAGEVLDAAMSRLNAVNPTLNAVVRTLESEARSAIEAGLPQGPFTGVPYLIKDITTQMRGVPTSAGSRLFANAVAENDSALVANYRRAGFVLFGKTNTPEFGLLGITEPDLYGATLNPWNLERTCGGSSGGAASAVAAGIVPAAQASDGGGSIRIPASCCGLFGMKPSRGRVSMAPGGEGWGGLTVLHAETRTVRDSAAILDASCQPQPGDIYVTAPPATPFAQEVGRDPGKLRIGFLPTNLYGGEMDSEITAGVRDTAKLCEKLGHNVEEVKPPVDIHEMISAALTVISTAVANTVGSEAERRGRPIADGEIEHITRTIYEQGKSYTAVQYMRAIQTLHAMSRRLAPFFQKYDVLLLSTLGRLPLPVGAVKNASTDLAALTQKFYDYGPNTQLFNVTGQPAMSVPLAWASDGTPIGIQFVGRFADEATLFRLAGQLEREVHWSNRRPPEHAAYSR
jgi:Asp-tRNA(Asn)/Glu-tRNA(Gln) amidotransferase A subunit family amidase